MSKPTAKTIDSMNLEELAAALVAGVVTILVATATVMIGRYYERKKELDALYRDKKTEIYDEFLKELFDLFFSAGEKPVDHPEKGPRAVLARVHKEVSPVEWTGSHRSIHRLERASRQRNS